MLSRTSFRLKLRYSSVKIFANAAQNAAFSTLASGRGANVSSTKRSGSQMAMQTEQRDTWEPTPNVTTVPAPKATMVPKVATVVSMQDAWHRNLTGEEWLAGQRPVDWYTGKPPVYGLCPGVQEDGNVRSLPMLNLNQVTRKTTREYFDNTWTMFETMFAGLNGEETFYRPPVHGLRHPQIFYYGHPACLYVNKLRVAGILTDPVDTYLESVLETGVDEMLWDDMHKFDNPWPTVKQVHDYRKKVYEIVCKIIEEHPALEDNGGSSPIKVTMNDPIWALFMGFEHDRIHLETSSVLFREMPQHLVQVPMSFPPVFPAPAVQPQSPVAGTDFPENEMLPVASNKVTLGKTQDHPAYGWDNEYGQRQVDVPAFEASKYMVSNGEFLQFVKAGGYIEEKYWCSMGWNWRSFRNMKWPFFWQPDGPSGSHLYKLRTIFETVPMRWALPVEVNYYEARAFGRWKAEQEGQSMDKYRLITEAEHHLIRHDPSHSQAKQDPMSDRVMTACGTDFAKLGKAGNANLNLAYSSASPVDAMEPSPTGHHDAMGNAWEWTEDDFNSLDGFKPHPTYMDFSTPCFDGQHNMIMGGSFMSTGNSASGFGRYAFRPHFLQHSGFRLVRSNHPTPAKKLKIKAKNGYETQELVSQYLGMHFALKSGEQEGVSAILEHDFAPAHALRFPQRCAELLRALKPQHTNGRALDVGCAVGGTAFELATTFDEVVAIDFSQAFVDAATRMQRGDKVSFSLSTEGVLGKELLAVHEPHIDQASRDRVVFQRGNACELSVDSLGGSKFDGIVVANLICRVPDPLACLDGLAACTNPGGVVLLCTPFSWLEEHTPKNNWLGGYTCPETGEPVYSKDRLKAEMEARGFTKIHEEQMPALIREHQRKYQYIISEATGWRRL